VDIYADGLSAAFEYLACALFRDLRPHHWYDGLANCRVFQGKVRQVKFVGEMWVAKDSSKQWLEPFSATVTDMRSTKQGVRISIQIGEYSVEEDLASLADPGV
jgi:hypothetical protein